MNSEEFKSTPFPIDFDLLDKGAVIDATVIEEFGNVKRTERNYGLASMKLKNAIFAALAARGLFVTIVSEDDDLRILTDVEAAEYSGGQFESGRSKMVRAHVNALHVDRGALDQKQQEEHDARLIAQAAQLSAVRGARKKLNLPHEKDDRPKMVAD